MFEEPFSLEDEIYGVVEEYQSFIAAYRDHVVRLLDRFWPFGGDAASADLVAGFDLMVHIDQLVAMEGFRDRLLAVLEKTDDLRATSYRMRPGVSTAAASGNDAGMPDTSTREPGSEGRARPESGQRKTADSEADETA